MGVFLGVCDERVVCYLRIRITIGRMIPASRINLLGPAAKATPSTPATATG